MTMPTEKPSADEALEEIAVRHLRGLLDDQALAGVQFASTNDDLIAKSIAGVIAAVAQESHALGRAGAEAEIERLRGVIAKNHDDRFPQCRADLADLESANRTLRANRDDLRDQLRVAREQMKELREKWEDRNAVAQEKYGKVTKRLAKLEAALAKVPHLWQPRHSATKPRPCEPESAGHDKQRCANFGGQCAFEALAATGEEATSGPEALVPNPCTICGNPILQGAYIGTGDGQMTNGGSFAHATCYRKEKEKL